MAEPKPYPFYVPIERAFAEVVTGLEDPAFTMRLLESTGRLSHKSGESKSEESADKFVRMLVKLGHESVLEHRTVTVRVVCDRAMSHQWVRHRLASFTQESQRYVRYDVGDIVYIDPEFRSATDGKRWTASAATLLDAPADIRFCYEAFGMSCKHATQFYKSLRDRGAAPEDARAVLPNATKTEFVITANLREWRHIFKERCAPGAQHTIRRVMIGLLHQFAEALPACFDDICMT